MSNIIQNAVRIVEGDKVTYLVSSHRHDYNRYEFKNGATYAVDGGREYFRRSFSGTHECQADSLVENYNLSLDSDRASILNKLLWGTPAPISEDPLVYFPVKELTISHLVGILAYFKEFRGHIRPLDELRRSVINHWLEKKSQSTQ